MADGSRLVAYEGNHRIAAHSAGWRGLLAEPELAHLPPETAELPANQGIESIAVAADGTLAILAETTGEDGSSPAWLRRDGRWEPRRYRPRSQERRGGERWVSTWRCRRTPDHYKKK